MPYYGYNYFQNYQPVIYPQPVPQQQNVPYVPQPQPQQQQTNAEQQDRIPPISVVGWVDGQNAAKAKELPFGTTGLFLDSQDQRFYIKSMGYDGVPRPLFIAKYQQVTEEDLNPSHEPAHAPAPEVDLSGYIKKDELDEKLAGLSQFVTEEGLEDRVLRIIQEKMMPSVPKAAVKKTASKSTEKEEE